MGGYIESCVVYSISRYIIYVVNVCIYAYALYIFMLTFSNANSTMSWCFGMPAKQITSGFEYVYDDKVLKQTMITIINRNNNNKNSNNFYPKTSKWMNEQSSEQTNNHNHNNKKKHSSLLFQWIVRVWALAHIIFTVALDLSVFWFRSHCKQLLLYSFSFLFEQNKGRKRVKKTSSVFSLAYVWVWMRTSLYNWFKFNVIQALYSWIRCMLILYIFIYFCDAYFDKHHHHQKRRQQRRRRQMKTYSWAQKYKKKNAHTHKKEKFNYIHLFFIHNIFLFLFCCFFFFFSALHLIHRSFFPLIFCCLHTKHINNCTQREREHKRKERELKQRRRKKYMQLSSNECAHARSIARSLTRLKAHSIYLKFNLRIDRARSSKIVKSVSNIHTVILNF